ncbi:MAG: transcription-repair coupling factor [Candidatus Pacebacteria bacterium]|nr:transcription-repair coupling factor [Candidatus Paceibacterota bacterium]
MKQIIAAAQKSLSERIRLYGVPRAVDSQFLAELARDSSQPIVHFARDDSRLGEIVDGLAWFAPELQVIVYPAWDCLPYDRVSPRSHLVVERLAALRQIKAMAADRPVIVLTTVAAALQRLVPPAELPEPFELLVGSRIGLAAVVTLLSEQHFHRVATVREAGEFAVRGGLIDVFPPSLDQPVRIDFFGDQIESIKQFDTGTQLSQQPLERLTIGTVTELVLNEASIARFRSGYRAAFGAELQGDVLYEAISSGQTYPGMDHWLPLFYDGLAKLFDYLPANQGYFIFDSDSDAAVDLRLEQVQEYYQARLDYRKAASRAAAKKRDSARDRATDSDGLVAPYSPLPPASLYLDRAEWQQSLRGRKQIQIDSLPPPWETPPDGGSFDLGGRQGLDFAAVRADPSVNLYEQVVRDLARAATAITPPQRLVIAADSAGSAERLKTLLQQHGMANLTPAASWAEVLALPPETPALVVLPLDHGFVYDQIRLVSEGDILGEKIARRPKKRQSKNFIPDLTSLSPGDLVVHIDHGIGRYDGLVTLEISDAPHDCLRVVYADNDRLFVPVENIEVLSRYGSEDAAVALDRLGGAGWVNRRSRVKQKIRELADKLMQIAALRAIKTVEVMVPPEGLYDEFIAKFPFVETEDQANAINDVLADLASGRPMDRLVCGDVGFGKTEVALRAAMVAALSGFQVAVAVPTTLLVRQHFKNFTARFAGLPVTLRQLSRLVTAKDAAETRAAMADGQVDIVIGTHALLAKSVSFKRLGLVIVDEEQHFGVAQKERLKELAANVHLLTLTATPIPRTLHMALSGVRDMSLIATPPIDRLAVRSFVMPYDPVVIREAILREKFRGGQCFFVCPRIEDLDGMAEKLRELVPEARLVMAHGQLAATAIEERMQAFCDGQYDILLSTQIVESGLDIPTANTIFIHRADRFGLAQLYQLRGRVGRAKQRGYAYLTIPANRIAVSAERRLAVMQTLDQLGAGFQVASFDLDQRGAGNLLGEEQSGQVREVGIELYQKLLEEAVEAARNAGVTSAMLTAEDQWSPQLTLGMAVLIPEEFVADLSVRLGLYRRLGSLDSSQQVAEFTIEMIDRFGSLPPEFKNLLRTIEAKILCRRFNIEKIDAGPKGAVVSFKGNKPADVDRLFDIVRRNPLQLKLRPDQKLVYGIDMASPELRIAAVEKLLGLLTAG